MRHEDPYLKKIEHSSHLGVEQNPVAVSLQLEQKLVQFSHLVRIKDNATIAWGHDIIGVPEGQQLRKRLQRGLRPSCLLEGT